MFYSYYGVVAPRLLIFVFVGEYSLNTIFWQVEVVENIPFTRVSRGNRVKKKMQFKVLFCIFSETHNLSNVKRQCPSSFFKQCHHFNQYKVC